jgi:hypothetical protein
MIKEIKNFLIKEDFLKISKLLNSEDFPWYYNNYKIKESITHKLHEFQFTHTFYSNNIIKSNLYYIIEPILKKINPLAILRIKSNLTTNQKKTIPYGMHTDFNLKQKDIKTGIYYVNTNNGKTIFENGNKIISEENKFVFFPHHLKHTGTTHTNTKTRIVINFNWI